MLSLVSDFAISWYWVFFGIIFIVIELFILKYYIMWIGISAVVVGVIGFFLEINFVIQLLSWIVLSFIFEGFRAVFDDKEEDLDPDPNEFYYNLNHKGTVVKDIKLGEKGIVHLDAPLLGEIEWYVISDKQIFKGTRIKVMEIRGQVLIVDKDS